MKSPSSTALKDASLGFALGVLATTLSAQMSRSAAALGLIHIPAWALKLKAVNENSQTLWLSTVCACGLVLFICFGKSAGQTIRRMWNSWRQGVLSGVLVWWLFTGALATQAALKRATVLAGCWMALGLVGILTELFSLRTTVETDADTLDFGLPEPLVVDAPSERAVAFDIPVTNWSDDRLGRGPFVRSLGIEILVHKAPVIAVDGPFGEGKTSALNLLASTLEGRSDVIVARFNSWLPGDETALSLSLFGTLSERVRQVYFIPRFGTVLQKYARLVAGTVPKLGDSLKELISSPSQEQQLQELKGVLQRCPRRIAVLIDEVDRMDAKELGLLLKIIRGVTDLPNISFVCAINYKALIRTISPSDAVFGRLYLEKFFPVRLRLPPIDKALLSEMFDRRFEPICKEFHYNETEKEQRAFDQDFNPLWQSSIKFWMGNIRRLSLFFNSFHAALKPVSQEVHLYDMLILQLIKQVSDEVFEFIFDNGPLFYYPEWRFWTWLENPSTMSEKNDERRAERIKLFLDILDEDIRIRVMPLLEEIFPTVSGLKDSHWKPSPNADSAATDKRIFHPDYFARYFINQVPSGIFGQEALTKVIADLNAIAPVDACARNFTDKLKHLEKKGFLRWSMLDGLLNRRDELGDDQCEAVGLAIARFDETLEADVFAMGEWGRARSLMLAAIDRFAHSGHIQEILVKTIDEAGNDRVAVEITGFCTDRRDNNNVITFSDNVDADGLKQAFARRMLRVFQNLEAVDRYRDREKISAVLFWKSTSEENADVVTGLFRQRFAEDIHEIPRFLDWVTPTTVFYSEHPLVLLDRIFPSAEIGALIREKLDEEWNESELAILTAFHQRWDERHPTTRLQNEEQLPDLDAVD